MRSALVNPTNPQAESHLTGLRAAARTLALELHILQASSARDLESVFASLAQLRAGALVIDNDTFFVSRTEQLAALTVRYAVPAIFQNRAFAASGGLRPRQCRLFPTLQIEARNQRCGSDKHEAGKNEESCGRRAAHTLASLPISNYA